MSKGPSNPTQTTVQTSKIPAELLPYYQSVLNQGQSLANQPYLPYGNQRLANQSDATKSAYDLTNLMPGAGQTQINNADQNYGFANTALEQGMNAANTVAGQGNLSAAQTGDVNAQSWNSDVASQYMNPYVQQALNPQIAAMDQRFGQQQAQRNNQAAQAGAFGGSRAALVNQQAQADENNTVAQMMGQGYLNAYGQGLSAFGTDSAHNLSAQQGNQSTGLQTNLANLNAGIQGGAQRLGAANALNSLGSSLTGLGANQAALGQQQQNMLGTGINALYNAGQSQQAYQQQGLDIGYQDFLNQQQYPYQQLNYMSGILNGFNVPPTTTQTISTPNNPVTQLVGAGLGLSGIANNLKS